MHEGGPHPVAPAFAAQSQFHSISAVARPFLSCWIRLYGLLCMEVLHQLDFAYTDLEPVFEECLGGLRRLGSVPLAGSERGSGGLAASR